MINVTMPGALYSKSPPPGVTIISSITQMTLYTVFLLFTDMVRINVKTRFLLFTYGSDNILNVDHYFLLSWFIMFVTNWAKIQNLPSTDHIFKYITLKTISPVLCDNILCFFLFVCLFDQKVSVLYFCDVRAYIHLTFIHLSCVSINRKAGVSLQ